MIRNNVDSLKLNAFPQYEIHCISYLPLCYSLACSSGHSITTNQIPTFYGPRAIYSMLILSIALALSGASNTHTHAEV